MSPAALLGGPASSASLPGASLTILAASSGALAAPTFDVVNASTLSTIAAIPDPVSCRWSTKLNRVGDFEMVVPYDSTAAASLTIGAAVKISLAGTVADTYLLEERVDLDVEEGQEAEENIVVRGRALPAFLDRGAVLPILGFGRFPWAQTRTESFASPNFVVPGSWGAPKLLMAGPLSTFTPVGFWSLYENFVGPQLASGGPTSSTGTAPVGHWFVVHDFDVGVDAYYAFEIAADNSAKVYVDGFLVADMNSQNDPTAFWNPCVVLMYLTAGTHRFAAKVTNLYHSGQYPDFGVGITQDGNPTWLVVTCWTATGSRLVTRVFGTREYTSRWYEREYPTTPPGMTFAQSFAALLSDAKDDGEAVTAVTLTITGADPTELESETFQVGDTLLKVLTDGVQSGYCDYQYGRGAHTLALVPFGTRGVASGITYSVTTNPATSTLSRLERDQIDVGTDALIVQYSGGQVRVPATGGTRMGFLKLASVEKSEAQAIAEQVLADQAQPLQITVGVEPIGGDYPWLDLDVGDTVSFATGTFSTTQRVQEMHGSLTDDGVEFELVVQDVHLDDQERQALLIQRANNGSLGGTAPTAPAGPIQQISKTGDGEEITFQLPDTATIPVESPYKERQRAANCYGVKVTAKTSGSTATTFQFKIDGVDVIGSFGVLPAGATRALCPFQGTGDLLIWVDQNSTKMSVNVTARGTGATGLLFEPQFAVL